MNKSIRDGLVLGFSMWLSHLPYKLTAFALIVLVLWMFS